MRSAAQGQTNPEPPPASRTGAKPVEVEVVVRDKKGLGTGLTRNWWARASLESGSSGMGLLFHRDLGQRDHDLLMLTVGDRYQWGQITVPLQKRTGIEEQRPI